MDDAPNVMSVVGRDRFDRIMETRLPKHLIDLALDLQTQQDAPSLFPLTNEVEAGVMDWEDRFADFGIKHPNEIERRELEKLNFARDNSEALVSAATSMGLVPGTPGYEMLEGAITEHLYDRTLCGVDVPTRIAIGMLKADFGLTFLGLVNRKEGLTMGSDSEDNANFGEADRRAMRDAAKWKVTQTTGYVPGTTEHNSAVGYAMLELTELQMRDETRRLKRDEAAEEKHSNLEPRIRPS
jgi:hypothetical protein